MAIVPEASRQVDAGGRVSRATVQVGAGRGPSPLPLAFSRARQQSAPSPIYQSGALATPEAFGANVGAGLKQGAQALADSLARIELQKQETELKTLDVDFSNQVRDLMYGNPDSDVPGYLSTQGDDALNSYVPLRDGIAKIREDLIASATTKKVRDRFTVAASHRVNQAYTQAAQHVTGARQQQATVIAMARVDNAINDAANDPVTISAGLATIGAEVEGLLLKQGQTDPEVIEAEVREQQSSLLEVTVASALGRGDPGQAAEILRANAGLMTPQGRAKASISVMQSLTLGEAQTLFDEILSEGLKGQEAIEAARERASNPEVRARTLALIFTDEDRDRASVRFEQGQEDRAEGETGIALAQEVQDAGLEGEAAEEYIKANSDGAEQEIALRTFRIGEGADAAREGQEYQAELMARAEFVDQQVEALIDAVDDPEVRRELLDLRSSLAPDKFTATVIRQVREKLSSHETRDIALKRQNLLEATSSASLAVSEGQALDDFLTTNPGYATQLMKSPATMATLRAADAARSSGNLFSENTNGETLHAIRTLPVETLATLDLSIYRHALTEGEFDDASRRVAAALSVVNSAGKSGEGAAYAGVRRILGSLLPRNRDYGQQDASEKDKVFNRAATNSANLAVYDFMQRTGKVPSEIELNDLVYEAITDIYVNPPGIGRGEHDADIEFQDRALLTQKQIDTAKIDIENISPRRITQMVEDAGRGSKYPTGAVPQEVFEQAYAAFILNDIARYRSLLLGE